ncbi:single-stranded DNA-binding protein [Pseudactinotalea sp. HY160]|uniref:single-stranded DNA-binding protein n=1 Tax=Pseudactinotalea sp. HY160 TaxID=2654490 RepID=UPI0018839465
MNNIVLVGNLTKDPKLITKGKNPRAIFTIAINERFGDEGEERTHFANATAWGTLAENMANSLSKGDRVVAVARLNTYGKDVEVDGDEIELTMTSFTVSAIGPDLRWAEAEVTKVKPQKSKRRDDEDDDEEDEEEAEEKPKPKSKVRSKRRDEDDEEEEEKPKRKPKRKAPADDDEDDDEF